MASFFEERRPHQGLTYREFEDAWKDSLDRPLDELDKEARKVHHYRRYNLERSEQVFARYEPSADLVDQMDRIDAAQLWMVLTDDWCGDSAYCLPVLVRAAGLSPLVELRILRRDDNLDIMDQYLTGTSRSIPKLVSFGGDGTELFQWGPRPQDAIDLRERMLDEERSREEVTRALLDWYADGGWNEVDAEMADAVQRALA